MRAVGLGGAAFDFEVAVALPLARLLFGIQLDSDAERTPGRARTFAIRSA